MGVRRGKDFFIYVNTDDPYDNSPTWSHFENVRDVTRNGQPALADASIRGSVHRLQVPTLIDTSLDLQSVYDPDDTILQLLEEKHYEPDITLKLVEILDLDGDIDTVGSKGIRMHAYVSNFTVNEALEDVGLVDISFVPGYAPDNLPRRVVVETPGSVVDAS